MGQITKIYELKTISYDQVINELRSVQAAFEAIKQVKTELNRLSGDSFKADIDAQKLKAQELRLEMVKLRNEARSLDNANKSSGITVKELTGDLNSEKVITAQLRIEKQQLKNEAITLQNARQAEINASKRTVSQIIVEEGSLTDLIAKRKQLQAVLSARNAGSATTISYSGQNLSYDQGVKTLQQLNSQITEYKSNLTGLKPENQSFTNQMLTMQQVGQRMTTALTAGFQGMKGQLGSMILMYTGWFAAFREAGKLIQENVQLSDTFTDLQIRTHSTSVEVDKLVESLKKIPTRTSLQDLVDIAAIISKKGVAKEEIAELTAEFDKLNVVLGSEIGDPKTTTSNIIKLITIFNDDKQVTAKRVDEIATSLFKLTTSGVATGEFLVNFAERIGAIRGITGLTLPSILGMGAALQQLGQRVELAGTAAVQLTTKLFTNVEKFARAASLPVEEFRKLLADDPFKALIAVADGLKNLKDEQIASSFEEVLQAFDEVGVRGVRVKAILGDIATNGKFVAQRMKDARTNTEDYARFTDAFALKQNTFAAILDKVRKQLELIGTSKAVQTTLSAVGTVILALVSNLGLIASALIIFSGLWVIANARMLAFRLLTIAVNASLLVQRAVIVIYNVALGALTTVVNFATVAQRALAAASKLPLGPFGLLIALAGTLVGVLLNFATKAQEVTGALKDKAEAMAIDNEISKRANEISAESRVELDSLSRGILSVVTSMDTKVEILKKLIEKHGEFSSALKGNVVDLVEFKKQLDVVREAIQLNAKTEAASQITSEKYKSYLDVVALRQRIEQLIATAPKEKHSLFSDTMNVPTVDNLDEFKGNQRDILFNLLYNPLPGTTKDTKYDAYIGESGLNTKLLFNALDQKEKEAFNTYQQFSDKLGEFQQKTAEITDKAEKKAAISHIEQLGKDVQEGLSKSLSPDELTDLISRLNKYIGTLKEGDAKLTEYVNYRDEFQKRLDLATGKHLSKYKEKPYRGARLTGEERDDTRDIESAHKLELALAEADFAEKKQGHVLDYTEEIAYTNQIANINAKYLKQKIDFYNNKKALNAAERIDQATARKEFADNELKRISDIQIINDKEYQLERKNLENRLKNQVDSANENTKTVSEDFSKPETEKAQVKLNNDRKILGYQENFNRSMDELEKKFNQKSIENYKQGADTREKIVKDAVDLLNAQLKDAQEAEIKSELDAKTKADKDIVTLLNSSKTPAAIARGIKKIQEDLAHDLLIIQNAGLKIELAKYQEGLDSKLKTEKDYKEALEKLWGNEKQLAEDNAKNIIGTWKKFIGALKQLAGEVKENILGIKQYENTPEGDAAKRADANAKFEKDIRDSIQQTYDLYFANEAKKLDVIKDGQDARIDAETAQLKARAQSLQEEDAIDRKQAAKKLAIEKDTAEKKKKLALQQLSISFAVAVLQSLAQFGLPLALIPIAGETAIYLTKRAEVQSEQFRKGDWINEGGEIAGHSHEQGGVPFNYEAEGQELAIINKRSAKANGNYVVSGSLKQIASKINEIGGGKAFSPGASAKQFANGGMLGSRYPAPTYTPSSLFKSDNQDMILEIVRYTKATNERIDRLEVYQTTGSVESALKKRVKQNQIGVI